MMYSRACLKRPLKKNTKIGFQDRLSLNAGQKNCKMLQGEHSAILLTFIKLSLSIKTLCCIFLSGRFRQVLLYTYQLQCSFPFYSSPILLLQKLLSNLNRNFIIFHFLKVLLTLFYFERKRIYEMFLCSTDFTFHANCYHSVRTLNDSLSLS